MSEPGLAAGRLRSHLLVRPAGTLVEAAGHMLAVQAQEFWSGRLALAVRAAGEPSLADVDRAFESGHLVRTWTQRGTLHIVRPQDLAGVLSVTAERQLRAAAGIHRGLGIDDAVLARAERATRAALAGRNRLTRAEFAEVIGAAGVEVSGSRANHILSALAIRGVLVFGPVVPRADGATRDQYLVATDGLPAAAPPADPLAELFVAYVRGHGPAGVDDFRWWAGLPLGIARGAAVAAEGRVAEVGPGVFAAAAAGQASAVGQGSATGAGAPAVLALPAFDEYYLSYADRTAVCDPALAATVGPSLNGLVRPVLVAGGQVVGTWRHSVAAGRHHLPPEGTLAPGAEVAASEVAAALARVSRFFAA